MAEITCRTCAAIKKETAYFAERMNADYGTGHYVFQAIVDATYTDDIIHQDVYQHTIERQGSYRIKLSYCPECGASIQKRMRQWRQEATLKLP